MAISCDPWKSKGEQKKRLKVCGKEWKTTDASFFSNRLLESVDIHGTK